MLKIRVSWPGAEPQERSFDRKILSIGSDPDNDIFAPVPGLAAHHAHLMLRGDQTRVGSLEGHCLIVDGLVVESSLVAPGSTVRLGDLSLLILSQDEPPSQGPPPPQHVLDRVLWFTRELGTRGNPARMAETLLDLLITALDARKGLLIAGPADRPKVLAARGTSLQEAQADLERVQDRLLKGVYEEGEPLILMDTEGQAPELRSSTVVRLGLKAVMALPLMVAGKVKGALILASDRPRGRFSHEGLDEARLYSAQASLIIDHLVRYRALEKELGTVREALENARTGGLIGASLAMQRVMKLVERVATSDLSVLITGETGTGKEVVARELHGRGNHPRGPFIAVNCGAIAQSVLESELFGHAKGAFTGATEDRSGLVEAASGGTLFLDEIGDMPGEVQVRLLRTLQERCVTRLGETRPRQVSFRLISATNQDLEALMSQGRFRQDLYFRIREVEIGLPPLASRETDIVLLARYFLDRYSRQYDRPGLVFSPEAYQAIIRHGWPGNVRELEGRVKRAVVLADGDSIAPDHLELEPGDEGGMPTLEEAMRRSRDRYVAQVLAMCGGIQKRAAEVLGVDPRTIHRYLKGAKQTWERRSPR